MSAIDEASMPNPSTVAQIKARLATSSPPTDPFSSFGGSSFGGPAISGTTYFIFLLNGVNNSIYIYIYLVKPTPSNPFPSVQNEDWWSDTRPKAATTTKAPTKEEVLKTSKSNHP